jgi:hypothetical protein
MGQRQRNSRILGLSLKPDPEPTQPQITQMANQARDIPQFFSSSTDYLQHLNHLWIDFLRNFAKALLVEITRAPCGRFFRGFHRVA